MPEALILPLPPSANAYWRCVGRGRVLVSKAGREFRDLCELAAIAQRATLHTGAVSVSVYVYFKDRRRDLDNALKPLLDAIRGVCYHDDRQVWAIEARKRIDRASPRVELVITPIAESEAI